MAWTEQMVEDLKKMWHEGLTTGEIGKRLGVSKNSIVGKVHRLQLSGRPSPIKKKDDKKPLAMSFIPTAKGLVYNMEFVQSQAPNFSLQATC